MIQVSKDKLREVLHDVFDLRKAYVSLLESGRDRIIDLGGQCDSVEIMEASDPALRSADGTLETLRSMLEQPVVSKMEMTGKFMCWCHKCNENRTVNGIPYSATRMILCPDCGNKRCPKATDHRLQCTSSNSVGQAGSIYTEPETKP